MSRPYSPSPRPTFDGPALISRAGVTRHVWGDPEAGEVADLIYASTEQIHCLVFALPVGGRFTHSPEFRTVFGADELLHVLSGTMVLAEPRDGRGAARRRGAERDVRARHLAPRLRARRRAAAGARAVRAAALGRHLGRARADEAVPRDEPLRRRRGARARARRAGGPRGVPGGARRRHRLAPRPRRARGRAPEHRAHHDAHARDRLGPGRDRASPRRRRAALRAARRALGARVAGRQGVRVRARARGRVLHPGRLRARVPRLRREPGRGDGRHRAPATCRDAGSPSGSTSAARRSRRGCAISTAGRCWRGTWCRRRERRAGGAGGVCRGRCARGARRRARSGSGCASSSISWGGRGARRRSTGATLDIAAAFAATGPVVVDSDVRTAGRAEALLGAGRGVLAARVPERRHRHLVLRCCATGCPIRVRAGTRSSSARRPSRMLRAGPGSPRSRARPTRGRCSRIRGTRRWWPRARRRSGRRSRRS